LNLLIFEFIDLFDHLADLEILKCLPSFPNWHGLATANTPNYFGAF